MKSNLRYVLLTGAIVLTGCSYTPSVGCLVQLPQWAASYQLTSDSPTAAGGGSCADLTGEILNMSRYNDPRFGEAEQVPGNTLAIRPQQLAHVDRVVVAATPVGPNGFRPQPAAEGGSAFGSLSDEPKDAVCEAPTLSPAERAFPNGNKVKYEFANVKFVVRPDVPGQVLQADLTYTETTGGTPCVAKYTVRAVWPPIGCETNADCAATVTDETTGEAVPTGNNAAINLRCADEGIYASSAADITNPAAYGAFCVPAAEFPSLN
jgi:hypothetical protein